MFDGIKLRVLDFIPEGGCCAATGSNAVWTGPLSRLNECTEPYDTLHISPEDFAAIKQRLNVK